MLLLAGVLVPVLRHTRFVLSLPMTLACGLALAAFLRGRGLQRAALLGTCALSLLGSVVAVRRFLHV